MLEGIRFFVYKKDCRLHIYIYIFFDNLSSSFFYGYIKELFNLKPSKYKELFNMLSQPCIESNSGQ